jgi:hypothetical protein
MRKLLWLAVVLTAFAVSAFPQVQVQAGDCQKAFLQPGIPEDAVEPIYYNDMGWGTEPSIAEPYCPISLFELKWYVVSEPAPSEYFYTTTGDVGWTTPIVKTRLIFKPMCVLKTLD